MKKTLLTGIAVLLLVTGAAHTKEHRPSPIMVKGLPPSEYDKPYTGELFVRDMADVQKGICKKSGEDGGGRPACSGHNATQCHIFYDSKRLKATGISYELMMRHELGHCNGWPFNHAGGKNISIDTHVQMPQLPASTMYLSAYPPVVCVTPEWKQEPCKSRVPTMAGVQ